MTKRAERVFLFSNSRFLHKKSEESGWLPRTCTDESTTVNVNTDKLKDLRRNLKNIYFPPESPRGARVSCAGQRDYKINWLSESGMAFLSSCFVGPVSSLGELQNSRYVASWFVLLPLFLLGL